MTLLDILFEKVESEDFSKIKVYDYWSIDSKGNYLFYRNSLNNDMFDSRIKVDLYWHLEYLWGNELCYTPIFIPYEEIKFLSEIEVEVKGKILDNNYHKYPLINVRGTCFRPCEKKSDIKPYCFHEIPCLNNRPDWNCWSAKYPRFDDFLFSVIDFIRSCPATDTLIIMFEFTPNSYERELNFKYVSLAVLVRGTKITFITDSDEVRKLYKEYNTRYPTDDRKIERSISCPEENFCFKF